MRDKKSSFRNAVENSALGIYLKDINKNSLLDTGEEKDLARRVKMGDTQALDKLVKSNLRFVVKIAKEYSNLGLPLDDLISEGNLGLIEAAKRFDPDRGLKFISYAVWWIRCSIKQAVRNQARLIRLPIHKERLLDKVKRVSHSLSQDLGRLPTVEELAVESETSVEDLNTILKVTEEHLSLEATISENDDRPLSDLIEDDTYQELFKELEIKSLAESIDKSLKSLSPQEAKVIKMRYGLEDGQPQTLQEIGEKMGLTRERIRQIEGEALQQLRQPINSESLVWFVKSD